MQSQTPNWSSALSFDGSSNVNLGSHTTPATGLSLSCWMKTSENVVYNDSRSPFGARPNGTANYRIRELPNDTYTEIFACTTLEDRLSFNDQGICGLAELEGQYLNNIVINGSNVNDINFNINPNLSF